MRAGINETENSKKIEKINKIEGWFFWKDKQNWQTFSLTKQEKIKSQISEFRNERVDITNNMTEIQRFTGDHCELICQHIGQSRSNG